MTARTMLQIVGANLDLPSIGDVVLLVIDAQREYVDGALPLSGVDAALANIARLLEAARRAGSPVIHIQHRGRAGGLFDPATPAFQIVPEAAVRDGETIVEKGLPNAFAGTSLDAVLSATGRKRMVICGFMTHMCVSATARAGLDLGYQSVVVSDATATRDLPSPVGDGIVAAADLHMAELAALSDRFSLICPTARLL